MDNEQLTPPGVMPVPNIPPNSATPIAYPSQPSENTRILFPVYPPNAAFSSYSQNFNPHFPPPTPFQFTPGRFLAPYAHVSEQRPNTILYPNVPNYPSVPQVPVAVPPYSSVHGTLTMHHHVDGNGFQFSQQIVQDGNAPEFSVSTSNYLNLVQSNESRSSRTAGKDSDGNLEHDNSGKLVAVQLGQNGCSESSATCQNESLDHAHYSTVTVDQYEEVGQQNKKKKMQQTLTEQKSTSESHPEGNDHSKSGKSGSFSSFHQESNHHNFSQEEAFLAADVTDVSARQTGFHGEDAIDIETAAQDAVLREQVCFHLYVCLASFNFSVGVNKMFLIYINQEIATQQVIQSQR